ncbi:CHRD domain-containing protein [Bacillus sp. 03113]|uniref:CHRD domain-containing protein n=1 Tax=Bacillus sp. 03113 TaxID=2578211 RepID=UPI0011440B62|nr:CHRD domain-containing protein [Bacillus sp. 03113]
MVKRFIAKLTGSEEVPPVITNASGSAQFLFNEDFTTLRFKLVVNDLKEFTAAHIHLGMRGENGPVVAFLFGPLTQGISFNRGEVTGTITRNDLVGPLQGRPLIVLARQMNRRNTYVNAHTEKFPDGEIRGQIRPFQ